MRYEPGPEDHPLFAVLLSPHTAAMSKEAALGVATSTARNALAALDGELGPSTVVHRGAAQQRPGTFADGAIAL